MPCLPNDFGKIKIKILYCPQKICENLYEDIKMVLIAGGASRLQVLLYFDNGWRMISRTLGTLVPKKPYHHPERNRPQQSCFLEDA